MTPKDFVIGLMNNTVDDGVNYYQDVFNDRTPEDATNPYWKRALQLYQCLTPENKTVFFEIVRQVSVDTVSSVLGIIDGVGFMKGAKDDFTLLYGKDQELSGDLQSLFLVEEENGKTDPNAQ